MKNLKRALSLVLATVMVIGMMVVGASAVSYADFTDKDEVTNAEAVALLNDLGIIEGIGDGSYRPEATIDRAGMAKLITKIMMGDVPASTFEGTTTDLTDIDGHWAEGYIKYCYANGFIAGYNGKFNPNGTIDVVGAAKLLLCALGYDAKDRGYQDNANWTVNVIKDASTTTELVNGRISPRSLLAGVNAKADAKLTRDNAAQMIFNALFVQTLSPVYQWDMTNQNIMRYETKPSMATTMFNGLYAVKGTLTNYGDASQTMIDDRLVRVDSLAQDVGTTVVRYYDNAGLVSSVAVSAKEHDVLATAYGDADLTAMTTRRTGAFVALLDADVTYVYQNGVDTEANIIRDSGKGSIDALVGTRGVITELIDTDNNGKIDLVRITEKDVKVLAADPYTQKNGDDMLVVVPGIIGANGDYTTETVHGYENIGAGDVVLYYQDVNGEWYLEAAESFTGIMTATTAGKGYDSLNTPATYTVGGTKYTASMLYNSINYVAPAGSFSEKLVEFKSDSTATYWLDNGGHIVWASGEEAPFQLLMVLKNDEYKPGTVFSGSSVQSQIVFAENGDTKIITVSGVKNRGDSTVNAPDYTTHFPAQQDRIAMTGAFTDNENKGAGITTLYTYTESNGSYVLSHVGAGAKTLGMGGDYQDVIVRGIPSSFKDRYGEQIITDSKTVFLLRDIKSTDGTGKPTDYKDTYTQYVGFANVPSLEIAQYGANAYVKNGVAKYVFVNDYKPTEAGASDAIYVLNEDVTAHYNADRSIAYFTVEAIVDGVVVDLKIADGAQVQDNSTPIHVDTLNGLTNPIKDHTLYIISKYDADGNVTEMKEAVSSTKGNGGTAYWVGIVGSEAAYNDIILLGGGSGSSLAKTSFAYDKNVVVYTIAPNGYTVSKGGIETLTTDDNDCISIVVNGSRYGTAANNTAKAIYVFKQDDAIIGGGAADVKGSTLTVAGDGSASSVPSIDIVDFGTGLTGSVAVSKTKFSVKFTVTPPVGVTPNWTDVKVNGDTYSAGTTYDVTQSDIQRGHVTITVTTNVTVNGRTSNIVNTYTLNVTGTQVEV